MNTMQKTIIAIGLLIVFIGVIFIFIIQPTIIDIKTFNDRIQMERVALENKYASRRNIKNIIADLKYASDGIAPFEEKIIVKKGQEVSFVSGLEQIAGKNNLAQKIKITPAPLEASNISPLTGPVPGVVKQNIFITLSGGYIDALKYINDLEKSPVYIIINSINIGSGGGEINDKIISAGNVRAYLEGYVYFSI